MKSYDELILDLDGTVCLSNKPIGKVIDYLNIIIDQGVGVFILTNNTSVSRKHYFEKLVGLGLRLVIERIISPVDVAGKYMQDNYGIEPHGFIVGTEDLVSELESKYNIRNVQDESAEFVLVGFDKSLTYQKLEKACELVNLGLPHYMTNIDLTCPTSYGPIPDTGVISNLIELVTNVKAVAHFGKPSEYLTNHILSLIKRKGSALLVGDRLYTDIAIGKKMGIDTLLVFSGETIPTDLSKSKICPTHTANTLAEFLECHYIVK